MQRISRERKETTRCRSPSRERNGYKVGIGPRPANAPAEIAIATGFHVDARLREQDYGERTGAPSAEIETERLETVDTFPGGESLRDVVERMRSFVDELAQDQRVLVIGHRATKIGFDVLLGGMTLEDAVTAEHVWRPGWAYELGAQSRQ